MVFSRVESYELIRQFAMVSYFSFFIGNGNSFFVNNIVEVGNYFEYTSRHLIMLLYS